MTRKEKIIYLAGIMDGEGTFIRQDIKSKRGDYCYHISIMIVWQKDKPLLNWCKKNFRGTVTKIDRFIMGKQRVHYRWELRGTMVDELAVKMLPYLIVKKKQVKRVLPGSIGYEFNIDRRSGKVKERELLLSQ